METKKKSWWGYDHQKSTRFSPTLISPPRTGRDNPLHFSKALHIQCAPAPTLWQIVSSTWCLSSLHPHSFKMGQNSLPFQKLECLNPFMLPKPFKRKRWRGRAKGGLQITISHDLKHLFPLLLRNGHGKGWLNLRHIGEGLHVSLLPPFKYRSRTNPLQLVWVSSSLPCV